MSQSAYNERTRELLIKQYRSYPNMKEDDVFKYIFQSSFGCEHLRKEWDDSMIKAIKISSFVKLMKLLIFIDNTFIDFSYIDNHNTDITFLLFPSLLGCDIM